MSGFDLQDELDLIDGTGSGQSLPKSKTCTISRSFAVQHGRSGFVTLVKSSQLIAPHHLLPTTVNR
ncbi:MAG: hypothetical protein IPM82_04030 [Saprospiraceae bacterium]|nr:hypothetical protein [Saprospiraceae bacterium]